MRSIRWLRTWKRQRLESSFVAPRSIPLRHWQQYYVEHALLGFLGRRLIWIFNDGKGWERSGIWCDGKVRDDAGNPVELAGIGNGWRQSWHTSRAARERRD